ncbi:3-oxoacyl-ACP synthase [uncultured Polaribacter sp.]|uniref:3-oxoacyl-ACP synthase n=1 Tax=uncultured Polaribacter sp. TaxID=174711 RepID=UPI002601C54B|nr:3-oxoacyl-ACP synthase [uncultured Polaribacter sp.]
MSIKEILFKACETFVNERLQNVKQTISSNQKALQSETKSSAGDKHETGRAMLQLEMEKASQQLAGIVNMKTTLTKIDVYKTSKKVCLGSIVKTANINYFIAISAGKLRVLNEDYYAVSVSSPIGKLFLGKEERDTVSFNGKYIEIDDIF